MTSYTLDGGTGTNLMLEEAFPQEYRDSHIYFCADNGDDSFVTGFVRKDELREAVMGLAGGSPTGLDTGPLPEVKLDRDGDWVTADGSSMGLTSYVWGTESVDTLMDTVRFYLAVAKAKSESAPEVEAMKKIVITLTEEDEDIWERDTEVIARALVGAGVRPPVDDNLTPA